LSGGAVRFAETGEGHRRDGLRDPVGRLFAPVFPAARGGVTGLEDQMASRL